MITLTPEETRQFTALFQQYQKEGTNTVNGSDAYTLFIKSGLPTEVLRQIWAIADADNSGSLDIMGFSKALRLIYHVQHGRPFSSQLLTIPALLPNFEPARPQATSQEAQMTGASLNSVSTAPHDASASIPPLGTSDKARFGALFDKHSRNSLIDGPSARDIFLKAKLQPEILGQIWSLVDTDASGSLRRNEFILAMHLIQSSLSKQLTAIPSQMPASWIPWLQGKHSYVISSADKARFDQHFDSLQQDGIVTAETAADFLKKSNLSEDVLAVVWDLADYREQGNLDRTGFSIAMFLVNKKLGGSELPQTTPQELIDSASGSRSRTASGTSGYAVASPQLTGASLRKTSVTGPASGPASAPVVAHANTSSGTSGPSGPSTSAPTSAPTGPPSGPPTGNKEPPVPPSRNVSSSMNDLVNLDDTFFAPAPTNIKSPVMSPTSTGANIQRRESSNFVPKSSFGQNLVASTPNIANAAEINRQYSQAQDQQREWQTKLSQTQAQNKQASADLEATRLAKQQLEAEINELRHKYDQEAAQVYQAQQETKALKEEMARLEKDHKLRQSGFSALTAQNKDVNAELEKYRAARDELARNINDLEEQHTSRQKELEQLNQEQKDIQDEHATHSARIQSMEAELANLTGHIESATGSREAATVAAAEARERSAQLELRIAESKQRAVQLDAELAQAREDLAAAHAHNEQLAKEASEAEAREKLARQELAQLQQEKLKVDESIQQGGRISGSESREAVTTEAASTAPVEPQEAEHSSFGVIGTVAGAVAGAGAAAAAVAASVLHPAGDELDSPQTSYKASSFSEQSSPRTSEFQINDGAAVPPSFTLPMARPQSATSSVANNPPQSVRGDNEDVSRPVSPEFDTTVPVATGIAPPQNMEIEESEPSKLYAHSGKSSDSFEFVDANDDHTIDANAYRAATAALNLNQDSSSDDEGPESFPSLRQPSSSTAFPPVSEVEASVTQKSVANPTAPPARTTNTVAPPLAAPGAGPSAGPGAGDFGDAFDDLEETIEDHSEIEDEGYFNTSQQTHAEPDEWQQLFADTQPATILPPHQSAFPEPSAAHQGPPVPRKNSPKLPGLPPQQEAALSELTSMGFPQSAALEALRKCNFNASEATNLLLDE